MNTFIKTLIKLTIKAWLIMIALYIIFILISKVLI